MALPQTAEQPGSQLATCAVRILLIEDEPIGAQIVAAFLSPIRWAQATLETAATLMHDEDLDRIPVVDDAGVLVGLVSRGDIVKAILRDLDAPVEAGQAAEGTE